MSTASDAQVLEFAAGQDFVVVTKDKDFADLVTSRGDGRQVLWVMLDNATTDEIAQAISTFADSILLQLDDPKVDVVQVTRPPHVGPAPDHGFVRPCPRGNSGHVRLACARQPVSGAP